MRPHGLNVKVYIVARRRHIAINQRHCVSPIVGYGVYVYLFLLLVPVHVGVKRTHTTFFKREVLHHQPCLRTEIAQRVGYPRLSRRLTGKLHCVKVHKVEYVSHVYVVEVYQ